MTIWTRPSAIALLTKLEAALAPHYHVALAGGVLLRGKSSHDLDVVVFPHNSNHFDMAELRAGLTNAGLRFAVSYDVVREHWRKTGSTDTKHVEVWMDDTRRVDIIIPRIVGF